MKLTGFGRAVGVAGAGLALALGPGCETPEGGAGGGAMRGIRVEAKAVAGAWQGKGGKLAVLPGNREAADWLQAEAANADVLRAWMGSVGAMAAAPGEADYVLLVERRELAAPEMGGGRERRSPVVDPDMLAARNLHNMVGGGRYEGVFNNQQGRSTEYLLGPAGEPVATGDLRNDPAEEIRAPGEGRSAQEGTVVLAQLVLLPGRAREGESAQILGTVFASAIPLEAGKEADFGLLLRAALDYVGKDLPEAVTLGL